TEVIKVLCFPKQKRKETASPDRRPPRIGDKEAKSASILGRMAAPIAFLSCDRYTLHVSQPRTRHLRREMSKTCLAKCLQSTTHCHCKVPQLQQQPGSNI
ncbi:hypothetical protein KUCAC02_001267, partial [Chaenocephalus aceratus]